MIPVGSAPVISLARNSDDRRFFQKFKNDEIFNAKVLSKPDAKGQVRLLIHGKSVRVSASLNLPLGQDIRLALTHEKNGISLKFLPSPETKQGTGTLKETSSALANYLVSPRSGAKKPVFFRMVSGVHEKSLLPSGETSRTVDAKVVSSPNSQGIMKVLVKGQEVPVQTNGRFFPSQQIHIGLTRGKTGIRMEFLPSSDSLSRPGQDAAVQKFQGNQAFSESKEILGESVKNAGRSFLTTALSRGIELHKLFPGKEPAMEKVFSALSLKSDIPDRDFLPRLISLGGLLFERKMASALEGKGADHLRQILPNLVQEDAKGQALSMLRGAMTGREGSSPGSSGFADTIESMQLVNSQSSESGRYLLPFPIADPQGFRLGQLFVDLGGGQEKEKSAGKKNIRIAFLLNMTQMGAVRADFSILDKGITGRFLFENADACSHAQSMIPQLRERLTETGFHASTIDCVLARPKEVDPGVFMEACLQQSSDEQMHIVI